VKRPNLDEYMFNILDQVASRSTCTRRSVGAIVTDEKGHIIATGYNGVPSGLPHCTDEPCAGAIDISGNNERCLAIHAEQNALLQSGDRVRFATRLYCSCTPCFNCSKLVLGTPIKTVLVQKEYADTRGLELLKRGGVRVFKFVTVTDFNSLLHDTDLMLTNRMEEL
jgi:dCMP deaminase